MSFNTNRVLRCRLIIEYYGPDIEYIKCDKNMVAYTLSRIPLNGNQGTTYNSTLKRK